MQEDWSTYWSNLLDAEKLQGKVDDLDYVFPNNPIEVICHAVYDHYSVYKDKLEAIRLKLMQEVESLPGVHLQKSRVKELDSLLCKIINKKYDKIMDPSDRYSILTAENYLSTLTDLVGIRLILSYRGSWKELHTAILKHFPLMNPEEYSDDSLIPLSNDRNFIAEIPHAYYAYGDDISIYKGEFVKPLMKETGYRSVHYILCFSGVYVEIQTRTIYDEAWSDCDHSYVYKHEKNRSHTALKDLSKILCTYTNTSNDLGDLMKLVYDQSSIWESENKYYTESTEVFQRLNALISRYESAQQLLLQFQKDLTMKKEGEPYDE